MGSFKTTIITSLGHNLMAKLTAGTATMNFTKLKSSSHDYSALTTSQLESLTSLDDIKQEVSVSEVTKINDANVKVTATLLNTELTEGYYIKALGLYATDPDIGEILYSVTVAIESDWMPPYNNVSSSSAIYELTTTVSNASNVTIDVDPTAVVSITTFNNFKESVNTQLSEKVNNDEALLNDNTDDIYLANFFDTDISPQLTYLYISKDGINFNRLTKQPVGWIRDCDIIFYKGKFYCATTQSTGDNTCDFRIFTSENLTDWEEHKIDVGLRTTDLPYVWAPDWFFDSDGKIYITISKQVGTMTDSTDSKTYKSFRPYILEVTDLENLKFGTPTALSLNNYNYIDVHITKKGSTYYIFIKKERNESSRVNGNIEIWKSTDLITWTNFTYAIPSLIGATVEGAMICENNGTYYLYVDNYNGDIGGNMVYCTSSDLETWSAPRPIISGHSTRHGSVRKITDIKGKKIIYNKISEGISSNTFDSPFLYNSCRELVGTTTNIQNKFIELYKFSVKDNYKTFTMLFNISDTQNNFINADFKLTIRKGSSNSDITIDFKILNYYVPLDTTKFSLINYGDGTFSLIYKVSTLTGTTPTVSILSLTNYAYTITESNTIFNSLPSGTETNPTIFIPSYFHSYRDSKNYQTLTSTSVTAQFYSINGVAKIIGHANGYAEAQIIDYNLMLLNGNIGLVKIDSNGATITVNKNSYSNGVYNLTITAPAAYSIFDLTLPVGGYFIN